MASTAVYQYNNHETLSNQPEKLGVLDRQRAATLLASMANSMQGIVTKEEDNQSLGSIHSNCGSSDSGENFTTASSCSNSLVVLNETPEKRTKRLERNRLAAKQCRQKKKQYVRSLEQKVRELEVKNATLMQELQKCQAIMASLPGVQIEHS
eukprot:Colp12_sorted_trinity150504_noHs@24877